MAVDKSHVPHHLIAARIMGANGVSWAFRDGLMLGFMWGAPLDLCTVVQASYFQAKNEPSYG